MVSSCCILNCTTRYQQNVKGKLFAVPSGKQASMRMDPRKMEQRHQWLTAINRKSLPKRPVVCHQHFLTGRPSLDPNHPDFAPSLNLPHLKTSGELQQFRAEKKLDRSVRLQKRRERKMSAEKIAKGATEVQSESNPAIMSSNEDNICTTAEPSCSSIAKQEANTEPISPKAHEDSLPPVMSWTSNSQLNETQLRITKMFRKQEYAAEPKSPASGGPRHPVVWHYIAQKLPKQLVDKPDPNSVVWRCIRKPLNSGSTSKVKAKTPETHTPERIVQVPSLPEMMNRYPVGPVSEDSENQEMLSGEISLREKPRILQKVVRKASSEIPPYTIAVPPVNEAAKGAVPTRRKQSLNTQTRLNQTRAAGSEPNKSSPNMPRLPALSVPSKPLGKQPSVPPLVHLSCVSSEIVGGYRSGPNNKPNGPVVPKQVGAIEPDVKLTKAVTPKRVIAPKQSVAPEQYTLPKVSFGGTKQVKRAFSSVGLKDITRKNREKRRKTVTWKDEGDLREDDSDGNGSTTDTDEEGKRETCKQLATEMTKRAKQDALSNRLLNSPADDKASNKNGTVSRNASVQIPSLKKLVLSPPIYPKALSLGCSMDNDISSVLYLKNAQNRSNLVLDGSISADESKTIIADQDEDVSAFTVNEKLESVTDSARDGSVVDLAGDDGSGEDDGDIAYPADCGYLAAQAEGDKSLAYQAEETCVTDDECAMVSEKEEEFTTNSCAEGDLEPTTDSIRDDASTLDALQDGECPVPPKHDVLLDQIVDCEPTSNRLEDNSGDMRRYDGPTIVDYKTYDQGNVSTGCSGHAVSAANQLEANVFSNPESRHRQPQSPALPINVIIEEVNPPDSIRSFFELLEEMYRALLPEVQTVVEENLFSVMKQASQLNEDMQSGIIQRNAWSMQKCA